jgi:hypothetical protein
LLLSCYYSCPCHSYYRSATVIVITAVACYFLCCRRCRWLSQLSPSLLFRVAVYSMLSLTTFIISEIYLLTDSYNQGATLLGPQGLLCSGAYKHLFWCWGAVFVVGGNDLQRCAFASSYIINCGCAELLLASTSFDLQAVVTIETVLSHMIGKGTAQLAHQAANYFTSK